MIDEQGITEMVLRLMLWCAVVILAAIGVASAINRGMFPANAGLSIAWCQE